jgi:hypothetical protein
MDNQHNDNVETYPFLENSYSLIAAINEDNEQWRIFLNIAKSGFLILSMILLVISLAIVLPNQRYLVIWNTIPLFSSTTRLEIAILVGGFLSAIYLCLLLLSIIFKVLGRVFHNIVKIMEHFYTQAVSKPVSSIKQLLLNWIFETKTWKYFYKVGQEVGYKYILYPALPTLEPDTDRKAVLKTLLRQMPPNAYSDEKLCNSTLKKYIDFWNRIVMLLVYVFSGAFIGCIYLSSIIIKPVIYIIKLSPFPIDYILEQIIGFAVIGLMSLISFAWLYGILAVFYERLNAWKECGLQMRIRRQIEEDAKAITTTISDQFHIGLDKLRDVYSREYELTKLAIAEREQAINRLKHLAEQPDLDEQSLKSMMWLLEFALEKRRKEDAALQK